ncbi:head GIN domain-containing protein [Algivirga pacifica]
MKKLLGIIGISTLLMGCESIIGIQGEGEAIMKEIVVDAPITAIDLETSANVYLTQVENEQSIEVHGQENIIDLLRTNVEDGEWEIDFKQSVAKREPLEIYISVKDLSKVEIDGSGNIELLTTFQSEKSFDLEIEGSGNFEGDINTEKLMVAIDGSGEVVLSGSAKEVDYEIEGSGNIHAETLLGQQATIDISGSGDVYTQIESNMVVDISGSGNVYYLGTPKVEAEISGSGKVMALD